MLLIDSVYPCASKWDKLVVTHVVPSLYSRDVNHTRYLHEPVSTSDDQFNSLFVNNSQELQKVVDDIKALSFAKFEAKPITGIKEFILTYDTAFWRSFIVTWLFVLTVLFAAPCIKNKWLLCTQSRTVYVDRQSKRKQKQMRIQTNHLAAIEATQVATCPEINELETPV
jgi:hypothetical protein